jgi:hypothetical protein
MYVQRNIYALSHNHFCSGKAIIITYSGCVSAALVIRRKMRMYRIALSSVAPLAGPYSTLSHKRYGLYKNGIEQHMCILIFSANFV